MLNQYPFTKSEYKSIYSKVPRVTAEAIIIKKGQILLVKRNLPDWFGYWHIPGVTILLGETIKMAIKRAAYQEAGVNIDILDFLGPYEFKDEKKFRGWGKTIGLAYLCTTSDGLIKYNNTGEQIKLFKNAPKKTIREQVPIINKALSLYAKITT